MSRRLAVVLLFAALVWPAPAGAQSVVAYAFATPGHLLSLTTLPATVTGEMAVTFHGDAQAGCSARGVCAYSGRLVFTPGDEASVDVARYRDHGRVHVDAPITFAVGPQDAGALSAAAVTRSAGGVCTDEEAGPSRADGSERGGRVVFRLSGEVSAGRCAGPLASDLAAAAPSVSVDPRALLGGRTKLDFHSQTSFAGHGFAGTLESTVVIRLGKPHRQRSSTPGPSLAGARRMRFVSRAVTVTGGGGALSAAVTGTGNTDVCVLLDSCGLAGTLTIAPRPASTTGQITAIGPATRPMRDFLTALGLARGGRVAGLQVGGAVQWSDRGTIASVERQSSECRDTAAIGDSVATLATAAHGIVVEYSGGGGPFIGTLLRTRCPGPGFAADSALASGTVPLARLRTNGFTVNLHGVGSPGDEGYGVRLQGSIRLTFRLGRVVQSVATIL